MWVFGCLGGRTSFFVFSWSVFPRHYLLDPVANFDSQASSFPPTLVLRPCNVSKRKTHITSYLLLLPLSFFLWCCCLYILWLLSNLCLLSLLLPPSFIVQLHFVFTPSTNSSSYSPPFNRLIFFNLLPSKTNHIHHVCSYHRCCSR